MAAGDAVVFGPTSLANNAFLDLQAGASAEAVIHNVYAPQGKAYELYFYDGTNSIKFDSDTAEGRANVQYHVTNTKYVRIKNVSGTTDYFAADGMSTK